MEKKKEFYVDEIKREQLIKEKRAEAPAIYRIIFKVLGITKFICKLACVICEIVLCVFLIEEILDKYFEGILFMGILVSLAWTPFIIIYTVIFLLGAMADKTWISTWTRYGVGTLASKWSKQIQKIIMSSKLLNVTCKDISQEVIILGSNSISHEYYLRYYGRSYWSDRIMYKDILRIEYDEKNKLLRVMGPMRTDEWEDIKKQHHYDTIIESKKYYDFETWITIIEYFDGFEEIVKILEEKTGLNVVNKIREIS